MNIAPHFDSAAEARLPKVVSDFIRHGVALQRSAGACVHGLFAKRPGVLFSIVFPTKVSDYFRKRSSQNSR